jgi:hypothetical protein
MKYIQRFIQNFLEKERPKPLGRWSLEYCNTKLSKKVSLSNEDHCGSCSQYAITTNNAIKDAHIKNNINTKV